MPQRSYIRDLPKAKTLEERCATLANIPDGPRAMFVEQVAFNRSVDWIEAIVKGGLLDISHEVADLPPDTKFDHDLVLDWANTVKAMQAVGRQATVTPQACNAEGDEHVYPVNVLVLPANERLRELYGQAHAGVLATLFALNDHPGIAAGMERDQIKNAVSHWAHALVMLNRPKELHDLTIAFPDAVATPLPLKDIGLEKIQDFRIHRRDAAEGSQKWTPFFTAIQFSRSDCLEAMKAAGAGMTTTIGSVRESGLECSMKMGDWLDFFAPLCTPEALQHAFESVVEEPNKEALNYHNLVPSALVGMKLAWTIAYAPAMAAAGVFDDDKAEALRHACTWGNTGVIVEMATRIDWPDYAKSFLTEQSALQHAVSEGPYNEERAQGMMTLIDLALAYGTDPDVVFGSASKSSQPEPFMDLIVKGYNEVALRYLDHGLDPSVKDDAGKSLIDRVAIQSEEGAHVLRTYVARKAAINVMNLVRPPAP